MIHRINRCARTLILILAALAAVVSVQAQSISDAVRRGDFAEVKRLAEADPRSVRVPDKQGETPLHWAANQGRLEMMRYLFAHGAVADQRQTNKWTPMHSAASGDQLAAMQLLVEFGADVNALTETGDAPIHIAAQFGAYHAIEFLLGSGVDVNTEDANGNTPLAGAAINNRLDAGRLLIAAGADMTHKNSAGSDAPSEAHRTGHDEFERVMRAYLAELKERQIRDDSRASSGLNLRRSYAAWSHPGTGTKVVFADDFNAPSPSSAWSASNTNSAAGLLRISVTPKGGRRFLGDFSNQTVILALPALPSHTEMSLSFDLYMIRTMDGNDSRNTYGPDIWRLQLVDGPTILQTTFKNALPDSNAKVKMQAYPGEYPGDHHESGSGATETNSLGYTHSYYGTSIPLDAVYKLQFTFAHTGRAALLCFSGASMQALDDESWGVANVRVAVGIAGSTPTKVNSQPHVVTAKAAVKPVATHTAAVRRSEPRRAAQKLKTARQGPKPATKPAPKRLHDKKKPPAP